MSVRARMSVVIVQWGLLALFAFDLASIQGLPHALKNLFQDSL